MKSIKEKTLNTNPIDNLSSKTQLKSFWTTDLEGKKQLIHFTDYSPDYYLIVVISKNCHHCVDFHKKFFEYVFQRDLDKNLHILILSSDNLDFVPQNEYLRKIPYEDSFQFGIETPALLVVNGKGKVLFKNTGYYEGLFSDALLTIEEEKIHKCHSMDVM